MKKILFVLVLVNSVDTNAQLCLYTNCTNPWHHHSIGHTSRGLFYISGGVTPIHTTDGALKTQYVDESPSMDTFSSETVIKSMIRQVNFGVGLDIQGGQTSGFFVRLGGDVSLGEVFTYDGELGLGHAVNLGKKATIKLIGVCSYGKASIKLGDIYQNEDFIEVNNSRFYSPSVEINFVRSHIIARPEIELSIPFKSSSKTSVFFNAGYQFPIKIYTNRLEFKGENFYGDAIREEESIFSNNLSITHNEHPITSNVVEMKGLVIEGGFSVAF